MTPEQEFELNRLRQELDSLKQNFYANNFPSSQDFFKYVRFNGRLKIPHYDSLPSTCEVGEVAESGGTQYICSAADTWTVTGTQT